MKRTVKRLLPILLGILIIVSLFWYLFVYDRDFTRDMLLRQARYFERHGNNTAAARIYDMAYEQSRGDETVAIELARHFKENGNYTKAESTLTGAIADGGSAQLYIELCKTYVEQDKLLDAVTMLDHITDEAIRQELAALRPAAPTATPDPGYFNQYISVTVTSDSGTLLVTTNGEYPSISDEPFGGELTLDSGETVIYALSVGENGLVSPLSIFGYTVSGVIEEVTLQDSAIDAAVRDILGLAAGEAIYSNDLWTITALSLPDGAESYLDLMAMPYLETLTISGSNAESLEGIGSLTGLKELTVTDSYVKSADLSIIAILPNLQTLTLSNCSLSGIDGLSGATNLTYLDLSDNSIRDFTALSFMSSLTYLDLSHNALTSLNAASSLTALQTLDVSYNSLTSIAPVAGCTELDTLNVSTNAITSLTGISGLIRLEILDASDNKLTDAEPVSACTALTSLDLSGNSLTDITGLSVLNALEYFYFSRNEVAILPAWEKDCALITIDGSNNAITSVSNLGGLKNLNTVLMDYNSISSVTALAKCPNLIKVSVYGNPVSDVSALTDQSIIVNYNPLG